MYITALPSCHVILCAAFAILCNATRTCAQSPEKPPTVHASGEHQFTLEPQKLRLTLALKAEGTDAKSAIEAFLTHKERVKTELVAMKADPESIEFGATQISSGVGGMPAEMEGYQAQIIARISGSQPNLDAASVPKVYRAAAQVRAEWALPTTDADALALLPETLKEQVTARDLAGEKNKANLDEKQQEKLEELQAAMQENMGYYSGSDETPPFAVLFVAKVDDEARRQALKSAYDSAVARADMLASVSGHKRGELVALRSDASQIASADDAWSVYGVNAAYAANMMADSAGDEAQAAAPAGLKSTVRVEVEFALEK
jgi:uncharacterized protein YggE